MGDHLIDAGATIQCPHGASASVTATNTRVKAAGQYLITSSCLCLISGCSFTVPPAVPEPCLKVQWVTVSSRVKVAGKPAVLTSSSALCQGLGPPLPPTVSGEQTRVKGT
jgi:hypothetical protein